MKRLISNLTPFVLPVMLMLSLVPVVLLMGTPQTPIKTGTGTPLPLVLLNLGR